MLASPVLHTVVMTTSESPDAITTAVERALTRQRADATREVEAILDATLRIAERSSPAPPRVADIVAEARTSNQAFYRYFNGKNDLLKAVMDRGVLRLCAYLQHQMDKETDPRAQIAAWIRGVLLQVADETAARQSAAISLHLGGPERTGTSGTDSLRGLLVEPVRAAGSSSPEWDAAAVHEAVTGTMQRHFREHTAPDEEQTEHLVSFCLRGLATD